MEILKDTTKRDKNIFRFYPVGQGLFYYGSINDGEITFVYDCGTSSDFGRLEDFIDELSVERHMKFGYNKPLDFVVISHFHRDHINGLPYLRTKIGYEKIFVPYICDNFKFAEAYIRGSLSKDKNDNMNNELFYMIRNNNFHYINNEKTNMLKCKNWNFDFLFKPINKKKLDYFINVLIKKDIMDEKTLNIRYGFEDELENIYKTVFGYKDINDTSLMMVHYPENFGITKKGNPKLNETKVNFDGRKSKNIQPYTFLTGDANFDGIETEQWNVFKKRNYKNITTKGIIQIPHHGSKYNFDALVEKLGKVRYKHFLYYIVGYGRGNGYKHPYTKIDKDLGEKAIFLTDSIDKKKKIKQQTHIFEYSFNTY